MELNVDADIGVGDYFLTEEDSVVRSSIVSGSLKSPSKVGSLFELSCAHNNSPDRQFLTGYSGQRFKSSESVVSTVSRVPSIGYTGCHKGKVFGKIGKIELHRKSIAEEEPEEEDLAVSRKNYHFRAQPRGESFNENAHLVLNYETSKGQALFRGQTLDRILRDITSKLELKYAGRMQRHLVVRNMFALHDPTGTELCSVDNFYQALLSLGIMLPNVEFEALCSEFDDHRSGQISWVRFMNSIGANSTRGTGIKVSSTRLF